MLILGLGSNLGNSLNNLRQAVQLLQKLPTITLLKISPIYASAALLPENAPSSWDNPFLNIALACQTHLSPSEVLLSIKKIEKQLGRISTQRWAPRLIDIDILAWGDKDINQSGLCIPHLELTKRPFALWPLLDLLPEWKHPCCQELSGVIEQWGSRFSGAAPFHTKQLPHRLIGTRLMGILNLTPDSFSDAGQFTDVANALIQAEKMIQEGAEILDIGAESTRPGAIEVSPDEEWQRLAPILHSLKDFLKKWPIKVNLSVDTRHYVVAKQAITLGADWINDVSGLEDKKMQELIANNAVKCVFMHNLGIPANKKIVMSSYPNICEQILAWAEQRCTQLTLAGINKEQLIFDIGIGFGKTPYQSEFLLKNINYFRRLDCPLLIGHSRKSFLNVVTDKPFAERDFESALLTYQLASQGIDYVRVHNVALNAKAIHMAAYMQNTALMPG